MTWEDSKTNSFIVAQRLLLSPAHIVYEELRDYGGWLAVNRWSADDHIETTLAARDDQLVTLALAQFGGSGKVLSGIFLKASLNTSDANFRRAVRLAVLANRVCSGVLYAWHETASDTLRGIVTFGEDDEMRALLANPQHRALLTQLYNRTGVFAEVSDDRIRKMVSFSSANSGLNYDESNEHGPDMTSWGIHKSLWKLICEAPVTPDWLRVLHVVLQSLVAGVVHWPSSLDEVRSALSRWEGVMVFGFREGQETDGFYTSLSMAQEFRCLLAALYGRALVDKRSAFLGSADDPNQEMRCTFYGTAPMTPEQMQAASEKDGEVFAFAAVFNELLYLQPRCRVALEGLLHRRLSHKYQETCKALAHRHPDFNSAPVSSDYGEVQRDPDAPEPIARNVDVKALTAHVAALKVQLSTLSRWAFWGFVAIALVAYLKH